MDCCGLVVQLSISCRFVADFVLLYGKSTTNTNKRSPGFCRQPRTGQHERVDDAVAVQLVRQPEVETGVTEPAVVASGPVEDGREGGKADEQVGDGQRDQAVVRRLLHALHRANETLLAEYDQVQQVPADAEQAHGQNHLRVDELLHQLPGRQRRRRTEER